MYNFRLVYILATRDNCSNGWKQIEDGCDEFRNREAAKEYIEKNRENFGEDVYILRKEVSHFYDQKVFDINKK
tara:strand:- start:1630 stop:1848 length:219 start_codon:yes stop_codon:yes gene_type:complete